MFATMMKRFPALLALGLFAACGGGEPGAGEGAGAEGEGAEAAPAVDPAEAGTVRGVVNFEGTPPAPQPIDMSEESACADAYGDEGPMTQEVVVGEGTLANVFVYVKEGLDREFGAARDPVVLDQENCRYEPHVLGVQASQPLTIRNSDPLLHNINTQPTRNRGFNISQPQEGMETTRDFSVPEVMIPVKCDVHGWMSAYIGVTAHPYHAVSGEDGSFEIANLPAGDYVIEVWHERYGTQTQNVSVAAQETAEVSFTYSASAAMGADVPLGEPLIVRHGADGRLEAVRESEARGAVR